MTRLRRALVLLAASLVAVGGSQAMLQMRRYVAPATADLATLLPHRFAAWQEVPSAATAVDPSDSGAGDSAANTYDQIAYRTFTRPNGPTILLTIAYRRIQQQEGKIHRPELCYFAQGYAIGKTRPLLIERGATAIPALTFSAAGPDRYETVVYWIRIGDRVSTSAWQTRLYLARLGLSHIVPDGLLVRASILSDAPPDPAQVRRNVAALSDFLVDLTGALPPSGRWMLQGGPDALQAAVSRS